MAAALRDAAAPEVVAKVIVAAFAEFKPKLRDSAGPMPGRASLLRQTIPHSPLTGRSATSTGWSDGPAHPRRLAARMCSALKDNDVLFSNVKWRA